MRTGDAVVKLAAIRVVKDAVAKAETDVKTWLADNMDPGDRKNAVVDDGGSVGTVSYSKTSAKAEVHDRAAFLAWATNAHPTEVRVTVRVDADDLLRAMNHLAGLPDEDGQGSACYQRVMARIRETPAEVNAAWESHLLAEVVKAKAAVDTTTGEEIPGVRYVPGGKAGHVSIRQSDEQRDTLLEAWRRGDLGDLLDLVTTPVPELEATQ